MSALAAKDQQIDEMRQKMSQLETQVLTATTLLTDLTAKLNL